jgi:hypothetical protein
MSDGAAPMLAAPQVAGKFLATFKDYVVPPAERIAVLPDGLPADARAARLPAREPLQDVHRLGHDRASSIGKLDKARPSQSGGLEDFAVDWKA